MKKIILLIAIINTGLFAYAQKTLTVAQVPAIVKARFLYLYPNSKVENWVLENGNYEAEFNKNNTEMTALINPAGKLVNIETRINSADLPKAAQAFLSKKYPGKKITDAVRTTDSEGRLIYEAEVNLTDFLFDKNGKFIKAVKERPTD